jgi:hypothetical protein
MIEVCEAPFPCFRCDGDDLERIDDADRQVIICRGCGAVMVVPDAVERQVVETLRDGRVPN